MTARSLVLASAILLSACGGTRTFQPVDPVEEPAAYLVYDIDPVYEVVDIRYTPRSVTDSGDTSSRSSIQVFARHRGTGKNVLMLYDPRQPQRGPTTVIELRPQSPDSARR